MFLLQRTAGNLHVLRNTRQLEELQNVSVLSGAEDVLRYLSVLGTVGSMLLPLLSRSVMRIMMFAIRRLRTLLRSFSELERAAQAKEPLPGELTIFDHIVSRKIPARIVYEDPQVLAFHDINPQAPVHIVLIPKVRDQLTRLSKAEDRHQSILGHLMVVAGKIAAQEKLPSFRLVVNDGPLAGQSVYHLHLHLLSGRQLGWPPG